jgi:outer membrane protein assembly factor BamC
VRAWRIVGKSLTRKSLEIIDRNINDGLFLVQYDPNEKDIEDDSIWDEIDFLFGDDKSNEQEYQIRLVEDRGLTEVLVLDQQGTPLSQGVGLTLLNLMHDTIKADLAAQQKE